MAVLGISCNWAGGRISYAILGGTKNNPQGMDVGDFKLSEDVGITSIDNLMEVERETADLCKRYPIQKVCFFTPGGWEKPRSRQGWKPASPMQYRIEGVMISALRHSGITDIRAKLIERVASDLGLDRGLAMRERIRTHAEKKVSVANDNQRYAAAAALSILS